LFVQLTFLDDFRFERFEIIEIAIQKRIRLSISARKKKKKKKKKKTGARRWQPMKHTLQIPTHRSFDGMPCALNPYNRTRNLVVTVAATLSVFTTNTEDSLLISL
jgi:hypothetical protein